MEQERVWVQYEGETRRFVLKDNRLNVGTIAKHWKLDIDTIAIGPDPVEFDEQGLSTLSIDEIRQVASDEFEECGDGKLRSTPFKIQAVQVGRLLGNKLGPDSEGAQAAHYHQGVAAAGMKNRVFFKQASEEFFFSAPSMKIGPSISSPILSSAASKPRVLKADAKTNEVIRMMQASMDSNKAMTNAYMNAMQEITMKRTESQLLHAKGKVILDTLKKL